MAWMNEWMKYPEWMNEWNIRNELMNAEQPMATEATPEYWAATTSSLYRLSGVFSASLCEMLMRLPWTLYSFKMSLSFASAAARKISATTRKQSHVNDDQNGS